jgi:Zn-dependent protease/CBS domain-containing protein
MFGSGFTVARIFGIAIEVHVSWLVIFALVGISFSEQVFPDQYEGWSTATYWIIGCITALAFFATVLLHELAHALVAIRRGLSVPKITLFLFGGVSHMAESPRSAREEFVVAAVGPGTSLVLAIVFIAIAVAASGRQEQVEAMFSWLGFINLSLAFFNILPGFPLDGGRVLRSIAWARSGSFRKATTIASNVGIVFGYGLMLLGLGLLLSELILQGIWMAFIGWFLAGAARGEAQGMQLESVLAPLTARDIMHVDFATVTPGTSVQQLVDDQMVGHGHRAVMVANDERVVGIVTVSDVRHVPREEWSNTPVQRIMTSREEIVTVPATQPALDVLMMIGERRLNQVPVLEEGRMIGLITRRELLDRVQVAGKLGVERAQVKPETPTSNRS